MGSSFKPLIPALCLIPSAFILLPEISDPIPEVGCGQSPQKAIIMMPYLSCKKIENDVYNFPTWQYCKYKDIFDSRIIINSTAKFYISISYQKDLLSIDTRIFTPSIRQIISENNINTFGIILFPKIQFLISIIFFTVFYSLLCPLVIYSTSRKLRS